MPKRTEVTTPTWIKWTFSEVEFKELLGITDPNGVLTTDFSFHNQLVTVTLNDIVEKLRK